MNGRMDFVRLKRNGRTKMKIGMKIRIIARAVSEPYRVRTTALCP